MLFKKKKKVNLNAGRIIVSENALSDRVEGYNRLKDNLIFMNADGNTKVIQIESAVSHECKTTVASNLAVSFGFVGKKVALVELDFRRPRAHRLFNISSENGLVDYLLGNVEKEKVAKHTRYPNVDIITRGSSIDNPTLVFISDKFKDYMEYLRANYDYIILDCAPVLQVSDYIHISKISDGVLFLVAYGSTYKYQIADAIEELKKNDVKLLGTAFTMYDRHGNYSYRYSRYYYRYYKDYYSHYEKDDLKESDDANLDKENEEKK